MNAAARLRRLLVLGAAVLGGLLLVSAPAQATSWTAAPATVAGTAATDVPDPTEASSLPEADLVLFWGDGCPNCAEEKEWLERVAGQYPDLEIVQLEVWNDAENRDLFARVGEEMDFEAGSVPTTIVGERIWIGWTDPISQDLAAALAQVDRGEAPRPGVYGTAGAGTCSQDEGICTVEDDGTLIEVPLVGDVSLGDKSLLVSTLIIGFVDGINPCSLWVISVLLTIVLRTNNRRRVIAIGTTFLTVTAAMYALYMAAFYSALTVVGFLGWIQVVVALVAGVFGIVSVKDYFAFKKGLSFTISDSAKPGIYRRMREAAGKKALLPALGATVVLAAGVSLLETPCTAGFPVLWTGLLQANDVGPAQTGLLFVAYMIPFLLDELIVFGIAVATMRATKMQDKHGELLKLIAGVTMLVLAAVMVIDPTLMENPVAALLLFVGAFALAGAIHVVTVRVRRSRGLDDASHGTADEVAAGAAEVTGERDGS